MNQLRKFIVEFDRIIFNNALKRVYRARVIPKPFSKLLKELPDWNSMEIVYSDTDKSKLNIICEKWNTDKGSLNPGKNTHAYADYYHHILGDIRETIRIVVEVGIGSNDPSISGFMGNDASPGASLRVWREYFPKALIFGGDIDRKILLNEERIQCFYLDQTCSTSVNDFWTQVYCCIKGQIDLIIDDGMHTTHAAITMLNGSLDKLRPGGFYIIEDLDYRDFLKIRENLDPRSFQSSLVKFSSKERGLITGSLIVIRKI